MLVAIGSMPMLICNCLHERLANNGKIMTFARVPLFDAPCAGFLKPIKQGCITFLGIWATREIDSKLAGRTTPGHHECFINVISYLTAFLAQSTNNAENYPLSKNRNKLIKFCFV